MSTEATAAVATEWIEGRNGGKLRRGGPHGASALKGLLASLKDSKGGSGKDFWLKLKCGSREDRRTYANIVARTLPLEIRGEISESLVINIVTATGELVREYGAQKVGDLPSHGTCLAGESQRIAPMPSPSDGETQSETVVEIEEKNA